MHVWYDLESMLHTLLIYTHQIYVMVQTFIFIFILLEHMPQKSNFLFLFTEHVDEKRRQHRVIKQISTCTC